MRFIKQSFNRIPAKTTFFFQNEYIITHGFLTLKGIFVVSVCPW